MMKTVRILGLAVLITALLCTAALADIPAPLVERDFLGGGISDVGKETELGSLCADAMRQAAGTQLALLDGGILSSDLLAETLETTELFTYDRMLLTVELTAPELTALLEQAVSHVTVNREEYIDLALSQYDGFVQISGFQFTYDPSAPSGQRVVQLNREDGSEVEFSDVTARFSVCLTSYWRDVFPDAEETGVLLSDALVDYLAQGTVLTVPSGRIRTIGTRDSSVASGISPIGLAGAVIVLGLLVCLCTSRLRFFDI